MRGLLLSSLLCLVSGVALAGEVTSAYSKFDPARDCRQIEKGDQYVYAGTWACKGYGGVDIIVSESDDRGSVAFGKGKDAMNHCAMRKTFHPFNTPLSPVEWRIRNGKPFAAIERWSVSNPEGDGHSTWLVISAIQERESCHAHYVAGSYPDANAVARQEADAIAPDFDCMTDTPTVDSKSGPPPIDLVSCMELDKE